MKVLSLMFIPLLFVVFGCQKDNSILESEPDLKMRPLSTQEQIIVEADQSFSFNLMKEIVESDTADNIFISPL
ncbi:MAG: hypothetical protein JXR46_05140, partial [Calditrichaceae bacterium]|nr:hypothetical protein [Calditrichaceae bacterium]